MVPDPSRLLAQKPQNPQSWNLYAYVMNNPLIFIDPTGLDCVYANDAGMGLSQSITTATQVSAEGTAGPGCPVTQMRTGHISTTLPECSRWDLSMVPGTMPQWITRCSKQGHKHNSMEISLLALERMCRFLVSECQLASKQFVANSTLGGLETGTYSS